MTLPRNWKSSLHAAETHCPADPPGKRGEGRSDRSPALGQLRAGAGGATGTELAVQPVFDDLRLDRQWIAAAATRVWHMILELLAAFHWQEPRSRSGRPWLATLFAAATFAFQGRLVFLWVTGRWLGCVARIAADAFPQAR
jgi:hypothetical protein